VTAATTYLDYNATAPLRDEARDAMMTAMRAMAAGGNPSSIHRAGRIARRIVEGARADVAALAFADPEEVVFTSGGTEANALAILGALAASQAERLIVTAGEHPSVLETAAGSGVDVIVVPLRESGQIDAAALAHALDADTRRALVCVMASNNETGVIHPIADIAEMVRAAGGRLHVDAVQHAGKICLSTLTGAHTLALSAHKIGAPQGCGALVIRDGSAIAPHLRGGGQELRRRAGTENVIGIAGFGAAAAAAMAVLDGMPALAAMRDAIEARAVESAASLGHRAVVISHAVARLPNTACVAFDGVKAETLLMALDLSGVCVSSGSACSSGKVGRSHVLEAMGVAPGLADGAVRVSLGAGSTWDHVQTFSAALQQALSRINPARAHPRMAGE